MAEKHAPVRQQKPASARTELFSQQIACNQLQNAHVIKLCTAPCSTKTWVIELKTESVQRHKIRFWYFALPALTDPAS